MYLKVDICGETAEISTYERGQKVFCYRTKSEAEVIFAILDDLISVEGQRILMERSDNYDSSFEERRIQSEEFEDKAFFAIGKPYSKWHNRGINWLEIEKIRKVFF